MTSGTSSPSSSPPPLTAEDVVRDLREIPGSPKVLPKLSRLLGDGNSSIDEVIALIRIEPGIAAHVLQVANSAFYSKGGQRCFAVGEAVSRVGYNQVYEMVMHAVGSQVLVRPLAVYHLEAEELWRRSVTCGFAGEIIARASGGEPETAYTLGLLHTIGMVAVDEWASRNNPSLVMTPKGFPRYYTQTERALLGFTHADVGGILLKKWDFPVEMVNAVRYQYSPLAAGSGSTLACLIYAAKWMYETALGVESVVVPPPDELWLKPLRLNTARLAKFAEELKERRHELEQLMQIES